jgi:eukaryotic-like serine/threonine-protein kinase
VLGVLYVTQSPENPDENELEESVDYSPSQFLTRDSDAESETRKGIPTEIPKQIGHYQIQAALGFGAMGQVFKGYDPKLKRFAAIKILYAETPQVSWRFAQEARFQAKIDHPNVCKVYEVGEVDGKNFIAMQFIAGKTLRDASRELKLEEKLRIIKQVAEALHSAHKEGLIHRDIKPSNIMVVKTEDGPWKPYILDFGLAREQEENAGLTMSGIVVGTPHYMAPEQARGDSTHLDRRTDVYGLGATLYELLSGRTPYAGRSSTEVLVKVLQEDPVPLRKIDASIPIDLETIVMKCMQKEPQHRYQSAKELSEDLQRYLDGDPITARPARLSERLIKKARKNKVAAASIAAALFITLVLVTALIWVQTKSSVQARYAREFGEEVRSIESMMSSVYSAPIHDIRSELAVARKRLTKIEDRTREAGSWAYGPGHNALGLGYFAMGDYDKAFENLQIAYQSNYREPSTIYTLGKLYGIRYQRELAEASYIQNKVLRDEQIAKIEKELRDPAVTFLKMSKASIDSPAYAEGLIAFYQKRYSDALKNAIEAYKQAGWSYDAKKLEGDLYTSSADELDDKGESAKAAKNLDAAAAANRIAIELGRSRSEIYLSESSRWTDILLRDSEKGKTNQTAFEQALHFADQAIKINPDAPEGYGRKLKVYTSAANYLMYNTGEDPRKMMEHAIQMGEQLQKLSPRSYQAFGETGVAYRLIGEYELRHGQDSRESLNKSIQLLEKSLQIKPGYPPNLAGLGVAYSLLAEYEQKHGVDPRSTFQKAIKQYLTSEQINPNYTVPFINGGIAYWFIGAYEASHGLDPTTAYRNAIEQYQAAIKANPKNAFALFNQSLASMEAGNFELIAGRDPSKFYAQSLDALKKTAPLMDNSYVPSGFGSIYYYMANYEFEKGNDPTSLLEQSRSYLQKSIGIDAANYEPYGYLGRDETLAARWAMKSGKSPAAFFQAGRKAFEKSIKLNTEEAGFYQLYADLLRREAEWRQSQKQSASEPIATGLQIIQKALDLDSTASEAYALQGTFYLLKSEEQKDKELITKSKASLEHAFKINQWLKKDYQPVLDKANAL